MKTLILRVGPVLVGTLLLASASYASTIFVNNFSFETLPAAGLPFGCGVSCSYSAGNIPGWTVSNVATTGQFQPGSPPTLPSNTTYFNSVPDVITVGYTDNGTISQFGLAPVVAGVTYTLKVDVGVRKDEGDFGTEALVISGGGPTILATGILASPGNWSTFTATYLCTVGCAGQTIGIQLASARDGGNWDNVRLSDNTTPAGGVPEPATNVLMGLAALALAGIVRRKRV